MCALLDWLNLGHKPAPGCGGGWESKFQLLSGEVGSASHQDSPSVSQQSYKISSFSLGELALNQAPILLSDWYFIFMIVFSIILRM